MIYYVTGNKSKIEAAEKYLSPLGVHFKPYHLDLIEIQSDSLEEIATHKASQAYAALNEPILIMDAGWYIEALNGFPGSYMKYMNQWFSQQDFLNLMKPYKNKNLLYREVFCYKDHKQTKLFSGEISGTFLEKSEGTGINSWTLISLRKDGKSIAQCWEEGIDATGEYLLWEELASWLKANV